jgi:hypothetical protein
LDELTRGPEIAELRAHHQAEPSAGIVPGFAEGEACGPHGELADAREPARCPLVHDGREDTVG